MSALAFYIDAPLQSWGASSKYQFRETNSFPTKSAIIGLIAAAIGIDKHTPDEASHIAPLAALRLTVVRLEKLAPATLLTDFHTIGGGYDRDRKKKPWDAQMVPIKAAPTKSGGPQFIDGPAVITRRSYLTDAAFAAILEGDSSTLEQIHGALLNPVWGVWFGRKTCLPATPLTPTIAADRETSFTELLDAIPALAPCPLDSCEYQEEHHGPFDGVFHQSDQPVAYGQHHGPIPAAYHARPVRHHRPAS